MKFKEKRGNNFIFEGDNCTYTLEKVRGGRYPLYEYTDAEILIRTDLAIIPAEHTAIFYEDIQTAVNLMQILIKEGLV